MPEFTHLHVHSQYSLLDGLGKLPELLDRAQELGMKHLALTDHGVLYGLVEFSRLARDRGVHPILGMEAYLAPDGRHQKRPNVDAAPRHLTLIAKNLQGYKNLLRLSTTAHLEGFYYKPRVDYELLREFSEGLICLSGCLNGDIPQAIIAGRRARAEELIRSHLEWFGRECFYLELQHHPTLPEQRTVNEALRHYAKTFGTPLVATGDVHYVRERDAEAQDVLLCIQTGNAVTDKNRLCMLGENYSLRPASALAEDFRETPDAIENTMRIAEACAVDLELGRTVLPRFPVPEGHTAQSYLAELCRTGIALRYPDGAPPMVRKRLDYELSIIEKTGFASYFLIVQDFVNWAKNRGILVGPGRGSAAGSIVSYLLNITNIDPLQYDLLFERFLNPARVNMPDVDLDFADDRRDEVIHYVRERYGQNHVAQIITFGTMAARAAIRDTGRALGFPYAFCDTIAKRIPFHTTLANAVETVPELAEQYREDPQVRRLVDTARRLEGVARHASTHAAGVVISDKPLTDYVPLQRASQDDATVVTQYAMNDVEALGLLKIDLLGLKNLTILQHALRIIAERSGVTLELDALPLDDEETYRTLQRGNTTGVFQLESSGMKRYLRELKPTEIEDIIAMVSLFRPGPIELIPEYIAGKHGEKTPTYLHPSLEPILEKTYGIAIYQEQVLQIARNLAGFSLGEADILRKAVGKKIPKLLMEQKEKFIAGAVKNGVDEATAERVFSFIEPFAGYGFNRAHGSCYALIAYQTAYLKTHEPAAFMAALLTSDEHNTDRVAIEVAECEAMGITVLPPDVNESNEHFTVVEAGGEKREETIRFGLRAVKNVGKNVVDAILRARRAGGSFPDLTDFFTRVTARDVNKKSVESLAKAGAFDSLAERNAILSNLDALLSFNRDVMRRRDDQQADLFGGLGGDAARPRIPLKDVPAADARQRLRWEKELLGLFVSGHPLADVADVLAETTLPTTDITPDLANETVRVGGIVTRVQRIVTRNQQSMAFVTIEDRSGTIEALVFPNVLSETSDLWQEDRIVILDGRVSDKDGTAKVLVDRARELDPENPPPPLAPQGAEPRTPGAGPDRLVVRVPAHTDKQTLLALREILRRAERGPTVVVLDILRPDGTMDRARTSFSIAVSPTVTARVERLFGPRSVAVSRERTEPAEAVRGTARDAGNRRRRARRIADVV